MSPADYARRWAAMCMENPLRRAYTFDKDEPTSEAVFAWLQLTGAAAEYLGDFDSIDNLKGDHAATALCLLAAILEDEWHPTYQKADE